MYGELEQSAYNGYFGSVCYHPLFLFNSHGDCLTTKLRPGNVPNAEGWEELLLPEIERQPEVYEAMEERGVKYAIRYDRAVSLLVDLRDLASRRGREREFKTALDQLRDGHLKKPSFLRRLAKVQL